MDLRRETLNEVGILLFKKLRMLQNKNYYQKLIVDHGLTLLPLHGKVPYFKEWQTRKITFEEIEAEIDNGRCDNIGISCRNGLEVIDIDLKVLSSLQEQNDFWNSLLSFWKDNIDEFETKFVIVKTKNAGYHVLYYSDFAKGNQKLAKLEGHKEYIIETRGNGGQVVMYENLVQLSYSEIKHIDERDRDILISCAKSL